MAVMNDSKMFMRQWFRLAEHSQKSLELKREHVRQVIGETGAEERRYRDRFYALRHNESPPLEANKEVNARGIVC